MDKENKKVKYFYDEIQDQIIVNFVRKDFEERQSDRKQFELDWELNMNFFLGNQYCYISNNLEISDIEKKFFWENREVYNHIAPIIETRMSKLSKISPNFSVKHRSGLSDNCNVEKSILNDAISKNSLSNLISNATYWSEITGTSFYKISWENDLGDIIGITDDKTIKNGDVKISVCSPFEIYPDSNGAEDVEDCGSIISVRSLPAKLVNQKYGTDFTGSDVDLFEIGGNSFMSGISGRSNVTKVTHSKKYDQVLIIERYEKPTPSLPNGKLTIVCEDTLIYDGDLPYSLASDGKRSYPFVKQVSSKQIGCFWGTSVIERCIPIQRAFNAIKNKKHEFIERLASGVLSVEDGSVDIDNLESEGLAPGKILVYRNGATPPKFMEVNEIPQELEGEEDKLLDELIRVSSVSEFLSTSSIPGGLNSGSALKVIIGQDNSRLSLVAENIRQSITKLAKFTLKLYKQFAEIPRLCGVPDEKGAYQMMYWTKQDISSDDVFLENENELNDSAQSSKETILSLLDKGIFSDNDGKISYSTKNKILTMLGIKNLDFEDEISKLSRKKAEKENLTTTDIPDPIEIDDHELHIHEHIKFILGSEELSDERKNKIIEHIKKHKNKQKEEN